MKRLRPICTASFIAIAAWSTVVRVVYAEDLLYAFDIPPQALSQALVRYGAQAKLQIAFSAETVKGRTSAPVKGEYSAEDAIRLLLGSNEDLRVSRTSMGVVLVRPIRNSRVSAP